MKDPRTARCATKISVCRSNQEQRLQSLQTIPELKTTRITGGCDSWMEEERTQALQRFPPESVEVLRFNARPSPIQTFTVGPGISPGQWRHRLNRHSRALTAGGDFHPAPKIHHCIIRQKTRLSRGIVSTQYPQSPPFPPQNSGAFSSVLSQKLLWRFARVAATGGPPRAVALWQGWRTVARSEQGSPAGGGRPSEAGAGEEPLPRSGSSGSVTVIGDRTRAIDACDICKGTSGTRHWIEPRFRDPAGENFK